MATYADYLKQIRDEEEKRKKDRQDALSQRLASVSSSEKSDPATDLGTKLFNGIKSLGEGIVDSTIGTAVRTAQNIYHVVDASSKQKIQADIIKRATEANKKAQEDLDANRINEDQYKKIVNESQSAIESISKIANDAQKKSNDIDVTKSAGDAATTALNIGSLGGAGLIESLIRGGAKAVPEVIAESVARNGAKDLTESAATNAVRSNAQRIAGNAAKDAALGSAYGATTTAGSEGNNATAQDYARNVALGGITGAAIPVAGAAIKKGVQVIRPRVQDALRAARANPEAGSIKLPGREPAAPEGPQPAPEVPVTPPKISDADISDRLNPDRTNPAGKPETLPSPSSDAVSTPVVDGAGNPAFIDGKADPKVFGGSAQLINSAKDKYIAAVKSGDPDAISLARKQLRAVPTDRNATVAKNDLLLRIDDFADSGAADNTSTATPSSDVSTPDVNSTVPNESVVVKPAGGGKSVAYAIPVGQRDQIVEAIDNARNAKGEATGAAGNPLEGGTYHIQARSPEDLSKNFDFEDGGVFKVSDHEPTQGIHTTAEQADARLFNREQQIKDTKPKSGFLEKANSALFDRNSPLKIFDNETVAKSGKHLAAEDDPHALAQLVNGAPEAAIENLRGVFNDMAYIRKNNLSDELMRYGVAKQVVADREGDYPESVVKEMQGTIARIENELPPEQLQQLEAARRNIVDYHNEQIVRLKDEGQLSDEWYKNIRDKNSEYFTGFNFQEHTNGNERGFSTNSKNNSRNPLQSVKGVSDDGKFIIEDPTTAIPRQAIRLEQQLANHRVIDAVNRYTEANPDSNLSVRLNTPEDIEARIDLNMQNKGLKPIRNSVARAVKRDAKTSRKLMTVINNLEKKGLNESLKGGGERLETGAIKTLDGFGGSQSTAKAGQLVRNATDDATDLMRQSESANVKLVAAEKALKGHLTQAERDARQKAYDKAKSIADGLKQDVIAEQAGTRAQTTGSKLGASDTGKFFKNFIETNSRSQIDKIKKQIGYKDAKLTELLDDLGTARSEFDDVATQIKANRAEALERADKDVPEGYEAIETWEDGKKVRTAVMQPIADALKGKNDIQIGTIESILGKVSRPFRAAATVASPGFAPFTGFKDFGQWLLTSENLPVAERATVIPAAVRYAKGLFASVFNTDLAKLAAKAGAGGSNTLAQDTERLIQQSAKKFGGVNVKSTKGMFKTAQDILSFAPRKYMQAATAINRHIEYAPKLAEFQAALDKGKSVQGAAVDARNAVADMQNAGVVGRVLNNFIPFTNATLQGTGKLLKYAKAKPGTFTALAGATVALPAITAYTWNASMFPDVWDDISQDEKDTDFIIILGDAKDADGRYTDIIKIPKTDAAKVIAAPIEAGLAAINGKDHDSITTLLLKVSGFLTPVNIEQDGQFSGSALVNSTIAANPLVKVPVELATNKNLFTNNQITPDSLQGLDAKDQVKANTPGIDKFISAVTGGAINPLEATVVRQGVTAGIGNTDPGTQLTKRFVGARGGSHEQTFYQLVGIVKNDRAKASNAINKALAAGDLAAAQDIVSRYNQNFRNTMDPWVKQYGSSANASMKDTFIGLQLNLTSSSVKQRLKTIAKKQAAATAGN